MKTPITTTFYLSKCSSKAQFNCKSTSDKGKNLNLNIQRKPETRVCNGTVKDDADIVFTRVESGLCQAPISVRVTLAQPPKIMSPTQYDGLSSPEPYEVKNFFEYPGSFKNEYRS